MTVKDVLQLPSLKRAKVIAGDSAINKVVASVSVLEYSQITTTQAEIYKHINFNNDELVLTAFASVRDDVEAQCENIRALAEAGELGIILFYVGLVVPKVDPKLIETANQCDFLVILMPKNEPELTYSSVITEIMFAVFNDQIENPNFSAELVEKVSSMPTYQQNIDMVLRLLSDRLRASVAITNEEMSLISSQQWPQTNHVIWRKILNNRQSGNHQTGNHIYIDKVNDKNRQLVIYKEHGELSHTLQKQAIETIRISLNLWDNDDADHNLVDLLDAIIQNRPQKISQLAKQNHISINALSMLLIISNLEKADNINRIKADIKRISSSLANVIICEAYRDEILILPVTRPATLQDWDDWQSAILHYARQQHLQLTLTKFNDLHGEATIRDAYINHYKYLPTTEIIFPTKTTFSEQDLQFARSCQELINQCGEPIESRIRLINQLPASMIKTLLVFLLDARGSVEDAANILFIHRNTAKYRLKKISNYFGFKIGIMPESLVVYQAAAIYRIVNGDPA
ncbi:hypothetical protein YK48G_13010 [Lentilactobacillus fungorum]|uniref:PucR family transcriptional regulator n=1 Tax=Lentilactobacillus fungorum TaxID=2201250 RepID=A0ABQ3W086_9LACO|nr:PucR family transcriptional regulator [Lentilactobacillus fungorum]GHP13876.1 hypothetical protein YK48G_13010 [Lentilactobacillus fungorum]